MCVSAQFCEAHLPLLFNILKTSQDPVIRSNIVIALGDIAVSFGSIIDEVGTSRAYAIFAHPNFLNRTATGYMKVYRTRT